MLWLSLKYMTRDRSTQSFTCTVPGILVVENLEIQIDESPSVKKHRITYIIIHATKSSL